MTKVSVTISGDLRTIMAGEIAAGTRAIEEEVKKAGLGLKTDLRNEVAAAGLGARLGRTWRSRFFQNPDDALGAASFVWSRSPRVIRAFLDNLTIRAKEKRVLAVPSENAPKLGTDRRRISPSNWPEHRFGPLRAIKRPGRVVLLVADQLVQSVTRKTGVQRPGAKGFRKAGKRALATGKGLASAVMFVLTPSVRTRKRLDLRALRRKWGDALPLKIVKNWDRRAAANKSKGGGR